MGGHRAELGDHRRIFPYVDAVSFSEDSDGEVERRVRLERMPVLLICIGSSAAT